MSAEASIQGPAEGRNREKRLAAHLERALERAAIAESALASWRERALAAEADAEAAHSALDDLLEAFEDV